MLSSIGLHTLGAPPFSGFTSSGGVAGGVAVVAGSATAYKNGVGAAVCTAAASANAYRTAVVSVAVSTATATGAASAKNLASGAAQVAAKALGNCAAKADKFAVGVASAIATANGALTRTHRGAGTPAYSRAEVVGQGENWAVVNAVPVDCRAAVTGTTFAVAFGSAFASAACGANATRVVSAPSNVVAIAAAGGAAKRGANVAPTSATGVATLIGAPKHKHSGVGYQDAFGDAKCVAATSSGIATVSPTAWIFARAGVTGRAEALRAVFASTTGRAVAVMGVVNTIPAIQLFGGAIAVGEVTNSAVVVAVRAYASVACTASANAGTSVAANTAGVATGVSAVYASALVVAPAAGTANALALVSADGVRVCVGQSALIVAIAVTAGGVQLNPLSPSTYLIEVGVVDNLVAIGATDNYVTVGAIDNLVEAA
jgi:hypothetical protein